MRPVIPVFFSLLLLVVSSSADPIISEFVASNRTSLEDASGRAPDWIELLNPTDASLNLEGYSLSDTAGDLQRFPLPNRLLAAGERLIIFASGDNISAAEGEIHTNFKLSADGESLFLTSPAGTIVSQFIDYPALREDEAYGLGFPDGGIPVAYASTGADVKWLVPTEDIGETWRQAGFDDASWTNAKTGLGFDYPDQTGENGDVRAAMQSKNASIYSRIAFDVADPEKVLSLILRMKFEDGFVAFINGQQVAAANAPSPLTWNAQATGSHSDALAVEFEDTVINFDGKLVAGTNILAIHGLNTSLGGSDFLLLPELHGEVAGDGVTETVGYLLVPTPGLPNASVSSAGPVFTGVTENPPQPEAEDLPIDVTVEGAETVKMFYRIMYEEEIEIDMSSTAGQSFDAIIPAAVLKPGEMVRWRFVATSADGLTSKSPRFPDPENSPEYFGTVVKDPGIDTALPVFHRFLERAAATENSRGTRASVYYLGEFYDNVFSRIRGGTAINWPKKSYKIEFNDSHHFRFRDDAPRVDEFNLNATYTDKSYTRALLTAEVGLDAGLPSPETFHMRVHQNGEFFSVALFVEQPDSDFLRRHDLDTDGALYKGGPGSNYDSQGPFEKKTREHENKDDLQAFLTGLKLQNEELENFVFDHVDLPTQINFLAIACITQNIDATDKNHYLYRDTEGSGEWHMLPWDLDLTFGPNALNTDTMVYNADRDFAAASHPFIGATPHLLHTGKYNRLIEAVVDVDRSREMLLRRIRTLTDTFLATSYFPDRIDELVTALDPDVEDDHAEWLTRSHFGGRSYTLREANDRIINDYIIPRVPYLTITQAQLTEGAPLVTPETPLTVFVPTDDSLGDTWQQPGFDDSAWLSATGGAGYDKGSDYDGLLGVDLLSDTVPAEMRIDTDGDGIMENSSIYMRYTFDVEDKNTIATLVLNAKFDDGYIAYLNGTKIAGRNAPANPAWNSDATTSNSDSRALVFDEEDVTAFKDALVTGTNILAVQGLNQSRGNSDMLILLELADGGVGEEDAVGIPPAQSLVPMIDIAHVEISPASGNEDEEFIELKNSNAFSVDLSGWTVRGSVKLNINPGTVIPAGDSLFLTPNVATFRARAESPKGDEAAFVQGNYSRHFPKHEGIVQLSTDTGVEIASFHYEGDSTNLQRFLRITEINYNPPGENGGGAEFIELHNTGAIPLDLTGVRITGGIGFTFPRIVLAPGAYTVVVRDSAGFRAAFGNLPIAGDYSGALGNGGERLRLVDPGGEEILNFEFNDTWYPATDGTGSSLIIRDPAAPSYTWDDAESWAALSAPSPGIANLVPETVDYETWRLANFPDSPIGSQPTDDPDADGLINLLEYAFAMNPKAPSLEPITFIRERFRYTRISNATDLTFTLQTSSDLQLWENTTATEIIVPNGKMETVTLTPTQAPESASYYRLRVEKR
jgi:hypothetical protein